jgi:hypothetical protein
MYPLVRFAVFRSEGGPVPDGAHIVSGSLCLSKASSRHDILQAFRCLKDWDELKASGKSTGKGQKWDGSPTLTPGVDYAKLGGDKCSLKSVSGVWGRMDVTGSLRLWSARKAPNYGWIIVGGTNDSINLRNYRSREYEDDPTKRPKLEITYRLKK